jgi:hypothetical protein
MKIDEITEGFWDVMRGAMDPHNKLSAFSRLGSGKDRQGVTDDEWFNNLLDIGAKAEANKIPAKIVAPWQRQQIDQLRQQKGIAPINWKKLDKPRISVRAATGPAPVTKTTTPNPAEPIAANVDAMTPEERKKYYNDLFKSGVKVSANRG